jgi:hypothetical protein
VYEIRVKATVNDDLKSTVLQINYPRHYRYVNVNESNLPSGVHS